MLKKLFLVLTLLACSVAQAGGPWKVEFQDIKLPTQVVLEHDVFLAPAAPSTNAVLPVTALNTNLPTIITSFSGQPDVPRNITVAPWATTGAIGAGNVVVTGTDALGGVISENLLFGAGQGSTVVGLKAFKTLTSVQVPATTNSGAKLSIGVGSSLGIRRCVDRPGDLAWTEYGGVYETTRAVMRAGSATAVSLNTVQPNGTLDGAHRIDVLYFQNYRCF